MNASKILEQLMGQASAKPGTGGVDVKGMLDGLARQFGGKAPAGGGQGTGSGIGGLDVKSLLGGGALGLLVGSKRGRKLGGKALKYGAIAAVGVLAWKAWQNTQSGAGETARDGEPVERLDGQAREQRSLELLQAVILAARADGHIDEREQVVITEQIDAMGADTELHAWVEQQLTAPLDAEVLARQADSPQAAREIYLISLAVTDEQNPMERAWLEQLSAALRLEPVVVRELERQALEAG